MNALERLRKWLDTPVLPPPSSPYVRDVIGRAVLEVVDDVQFNARRVDTLETHLRGVNVAQGKALAELRSRIVKLEEHGVPPTRDCVMVPIERWRLDALENVAAKARGVVIGPRSAIQEGELARALQELSVSEKRWMG